MDSSNGPVIYTRKPGATATEEDRHAATAYLADIYADCWNPWRRDDEAEAIQAARAVLDQWTETGGATQEDIDAWLAARRERTQQEIGRREADRERRKATYDAGKEADRLALLEAESILLHTTKERTAMISGLRYPAMAADRRAHEIARLDGEIVQQTGKLEELRKRVPDPESVVDEQGRLPADRRAWRRIDFADRRCTAVIDLRQERLNTQAELDAAPKRERRELLERVRSVQARLDFWVGVQKPEVEQMCSECSTPLAWHVWSCRGLEALIGYGPCPAWPGQRANYRKLVALLEASAGRRASNNAPREKKRHDPRTKAQLLEEIDHLQAQLAGQAQP